MFVGLTKLYIGNNLIGDISSIKHEDNNYIFEMYDNKGTYKTDKLGKLDIILGAGDKIIIPE